MEFTNLLLAPLSAVISALVILLSAFVRPRSEERALIPAAALAVSTSIILIQPWGYRTWAGVGEGLAALLLFSTVGFALGALFALVLVKGLRFIRTKLLDNPR
jgi:hypothetical protein